MPVTIRDLARRLGLSITTVSRALDGYDDVAEETRQRVVKAALESGYVPSYAARHLRRQRADAIGYISAATVPQFHDPFDASFLTGLCDEAAAQQIDLIVSSSPPESELERQQYRRWIQSRRVDGIIINRTRLHDWRIEFMAQYHLPFISFGRSESGGDFSYLVVDDRSGFAQLVKHLVQKGHRRIAYIGASSNLVIQVEGYAGYCQGLKQAGIPLDLKLVVEGDLSEPGGYLAAHQLMTLPSPPTAILGCNDQTALGVLRAAQELGLNVGEEIAIAGHDGIPETQYTTPPLTTLFQPTYEIARRLIVKLVKLIEGEETTPIPEVIQPQLLARASTG